MYGWHDLKPDKPTSLEKKLGCVERSNNLDFLGLVVAKKTRQKKESFIHLFKCKGISLLQFFLAGRRDRSLCGHIIFAIQGKPG